MENSKREDRKRSVEATFLELQAIGQRCTRLIKDMSESVTHGELLYDDNGLPKGS